MISAPTFGPRLADCVAHAKSLRGDPENTCTDSCCQTAENGVLWVIDISKLKLFVMLDTIMQHKGIL